jgi:RND family efflux transporter MFP subunit
VLADFSTLRVRAGVTAKEAALVIPSATAEIGLEVLGRGTITGTVQSVARMADPATGTYPVEIWVDDRDGNLREGMVASVRLSYSASDQTLVVPSAAVVRRGGSQAVFVVTNGQAQLRAVETGRTDGGTMEIVHGLEVGERVVVDGQFALRDGAAVIVAGSPG